MESVQLVNSVEVEKLYKELDRILGTKKLSTDNIMIVVVRLMQVTETFKSIKGTQKKDVIIEALRGFIAKNFITDESRELTLLIDLILPSIIDTLVSIDKKDIKIKANKFLKNLFKKFCSFCK